MNAKSGFQKQLRAIALMKGMPRAFFAAPDHCDANPKATYQRLLTINKGKSISLVDTADAVLGSRASKDYIPAADLGYERSNAELQMATKEQDGLWHQHEDSFGFKEREEQKIVLKTQHLDFQKMIDNAPKKTDHDGRKGPLDVEVPYEKRHPHVADRLGHPEYLYNNLDKFLLNEPDLAHPGFTNQPFVQKAGPNPDEKLTFESGDVVYENLQLGEWLKLWRASWYSFVLFWYQSEKEGYLTNIPVREDNFWWQEEWNIWMNHANMDFEMRDVNQFYDTLEPYVMVNVMAAIFAVFQVPKYVLNDYAIRMRYSADKQLLFVTRQDSYFTETEKAYEMEHLEFLPPTIRTAIPYLSAMDTENGMMNVRCMNTQDTFTIYLNDKFWDLDHKPDFLKGVTNLWRDRNHDGHVSERPEQYFKP